MAYENIVNALIQTESGGNPMARNPRSSAGGSGQFIDSTWLSMVKKYRPDIAQGKSDAQLLQLKFNPDLSREMTQRYAQENSDFLGQRGYEATPGNISTEGIFLRLEPNAPVDLKVNTRVEVEIDYSGEILLLHGIIRSRRSRGYGIFFPKKSDYPPEEREITADRIHKSFGKVFPVSG